MGKIADKLAQTRQQLITNGFFKDPHDAFLNHFREQIRTRPERLKQKRLEEGVRTDWAAKIEQETLTPDEHSLPQDRGK